MVNRNEILIYVVFSLLLLIVCGILVVNKFSGDDNDAKAGKGNKVVEKDKKSRTKRGRSRLYPNRDIKEFIPEGVDLNIIKTNLDTAKDKDTKIDLLRELIGTKHAKILEIVERELDNPDVDVRLEALELLAEFEDDQICNNLMKAMNDNSKEVRELAMELLDTVYVPGGSEMCAELITQGINDSSEDVRDVAVNLISDRPMYELELVAADGIKSKHIEVKDDILSELASRPSLRGVDIMIEGLLDKNEDFRVDVKDELEMITDREFKSYKEAKQWWKDNKYKFEEEFSEYQDDDGEEE